VLVTFKENLAHFNLDFRLGAFLKKIVFTFVKSLLGILLQLIQHQKIGGEGAGGGAKLETSSKSNNYMHNATPTPSFYCSKNVYPNFFLKLTTCLTPD
jgi:hypothetical protein